LLLAFSARRSDPLDVTVDGQNKDDGVQKHFENEAPAYDEIIRALIPHYKQMVSVVVRTLSFGESDAIRVLDLGCGTGALTQAVLSAFPAARVTCVDSAAAMIGMARQKCRQNSNIEWVVCDFSAMTLGGPYDAVVSSLALHHLNSDAEKRAFYRRVYDALAPGGVFYNADVVLGASEPLQQMYMGEWCAFMRLSVPDGDIQGTWLPRYYAEDRPAPLVDQLLWLSEIGFREVDVIWKYFNFAVYGGRR